MGGCEGGGGEERREERGYVLEVLEVYVHFLDGALDICW